MELIVDQESPNLWNEEILAHNMKSKVERAKDKRLVFQDVEKHQINS